MLGIMVVSAEDDATTPGIMVDDVEVREIVPASAGHGEEV